MTVVPLQADERVVRDDGREVLLKADGRWTLIERDFYAARKNGQRVRLRADGHWEVMSDQSQVTDTSLPPASTLPIVTERHTAAPMIRLERMAILKKKTKLVKSVRLTTRIAVSLSLAQSSHSETTSDVANTSIDSGITLQDSQGRRYTLVDLVTDVPEDTLDEQENSKRKPIRLSFSGSPRGFSVKYLELQIAANRFGDHPAYQLRQDLADVPVKQVADFDDAR